MHCPNHRALLLFAFLLLFLLQAGRLMAQGARFPQWLLPESSTAALSTNLRYGVSMRYAALDQLRLRVRSDFNEHWKLSVLNETRSYLRGGAERIRADSIVNRFRQVYLEYVHTFTPKLGIPGLEPSIQVKLRLGLVEWQPVFEHPQLVAENADLVFEPESLLGQTFNVDVPLTADRSLRMVLGGHTGDLMGGTGPSVHNAFLAFRKPLLSGHPVWAKVILDVQVGRAQRRQHFVNHAHLTYTQVFEQLELTLKAGKLVSLDRMPMGVHLGASRAFKYLTVGGYIEFRWHRGRVVHATEEGPIAGFTWSISGIPKLEKLLRVIRFQYDFRNQLLLVNVPLLQVTMRHKSAGSSLPVL